MVTLENKRILITGGAGFIGSNLVGRLIGKNEILVLDNLHTGIVTNLDPYMDRLQLRVMDTEDISQLDFKPDVIFHLGMYSSTPMYKENSNLVHKVVDGAIQLLEYARKHSSNVVLASSSSIYNGQPVPQNEEMLPLVTDFYTEARLYTERLSELYTKLFGLNTVALRFFSVYGPGERNKGRFANLVSQFMWDLQEGRTPAIYGDGTQTRDFIYVDDVVSACIMAAKSNKNGIYNVGTGVSWSVNDMLGKVMDALGKHVQPKYVPIPTKNYVVHTRADMTKMEREIGFKAVYSLDAGLKQLLLQESRAVEAR